MGKIASKEQRESGTDVMVPVEWLPLEESSPVNWGPIDVNTAIGLQVTFNNTEKDNHWDYEDSLKRTPLRALFALTGPGPGLVTIRAFTADRRMWYLSVREDPIGVPGQPTFIISNTGPRLHTEFIRDYRDEYFSLSFNSDVNGRTYYLVPNDDGNIVTSINPDNPYVFREDRNITECPLVHFLPLLEKLLKDLVQWEEDKETTCAASGTEKP
jgi:hypothetical protein